jgi:hypothetical protein
MFVFKDLRWEVIVGLVHTRIKLFSSLFKLSFHNVKFRWDSDVKVWNYSSVITLRILQTSTSLKSKDIRDTLSGQCSSYFIELKRCYFCSTRFRKLWLFGFVLISGSIAHALHQIIHNTGSTWHQTFGPEKMGRKTVDRRPILSNIC